MSVRRQLKNVVNNYSNAEVKVREATSNDPWGPSSSVMTEIADATYNVVAFSEIMGMLWKRLNDHGKNWRHVYKSLVVLDYIIKTGSERVAQQCRENLYAIQTLKDFQFIDKDGKDQGMNVREKAKQLVALLKDEDRLKSERARALKAKERFAQASSGIGSDSLKSGNLRDTSSASDIRFDSSSVPVTSTAPTSRSWEPERKVVGSEMETCRPSNANEEELQLQLALALSKQEAEEKEKMKEREDQRLQLAINQSQKQSGHPQEPSLLDIASGVSAPPAPPPQETFDPWGSAPAAAAPPAPMPMPQPDPWGSGVTSSSSTTSDPWGSSPPPPQMPVNTSQNLFAVANGTASMGAVTSSDPWGAAPVQAAPPVAPVASDPWGGGGSFPAPTASQPQNLWGPAPSQSFDAFNQNNAAGGFPGLPPAGAFSMPSNNQGPEPTKQPSFLDNSVSNLVNLDLLTEKPDTVQNPFLPGQPVVAKSTNPFVQEKPQAPTLNQLRETPGVGIGTVSSMPNMGGNVLLPTPLIPESGPRPQQVQSNPFL